MNGARWKKHEEKRDPVYSRLLKAFMRGSFEGSLNAPRLKVVDTDCVREVVRQILPEVAAAGNCVIVGRGSAFYLGDRPDAFHAFIYAPFQDKVRRLQARGKNEKEAMELVETVDRDRADFIKRYFDVDWPGRHRFHLMVNSGAGDDVAVQIILDAVAQYANKRS